MEITLLGSGGSISNGKRLNTSLLIKDNKNNLLIDCSGTPSYSLLKNGLHVRECNNLLITHEHIDHIYALPVLIHNKWLDAYPVGDAIINIYATYDLMELINRILICYGLLSKPKPIKIVYHALENIGGFVDSIFDDVEFEYFPVKHGNTFTLGLSIANNDFHFIYSSDSDVCNSISDRINNSTTLIHDCRSGINPQNGHAGANEIAEMLGKHPCMKLILCHLSESSLEEIDII